jgi:hypothetical protein
MRHPAPRAFSHPQLSLEDFFRRVRVYKEVCCDHADTGNSLLLDTLCIEKESFIILIFFQTIYRFICAFRCYLSFHSHLTLTINILLNIILILFADLRCQCSLTQSRLLSPDFVLNVTFSEYFRLQLIFN